MTWIASHGASIDEPLLVNPTKGAEGRDKRPPCSPDNTQRNRLPWSYLDLLCIQSTKFQLCKI
jgi:hypothetical protein